MSKVELEFTGTASLVIGTNKGPIEFTLQDLSLVEELMGLLLRDPKPAPVTVLTPSQSRSLKRRLKAIGGG